MGNKRHYGDLRALREQWKRDTLRGPYSDDELDYRKLREERNRRAVEPRPPPIIPLEVRFEGTWIVGRPGTGKTQLFQHLLLGDLDLVADEQALVIVVDSTGDKGGERPTLIRNLTRLKRFAPGGDVDGRLICIDPTDRDYTLPINLLALRPDLGDDEAISSAIASYISIMGGLMGQPLTKFQDPVFRYAVQVALAFPHPTLEVLQDIIAVPPRGSSDPPLYRQVYDRLDPAIQRFLRTSYETEGPRGSRNEIMTRLNSLNADPLFRRIFNAAKTNIDFSAELSRPNVIVINASRDLSSIKELYGRYFLALIKQAAETRPNALPCFIYIDECNEFVANDQNAKDIILKLRRNRVGLILGNQLTSQISDPEVREAFKGTAIKFVNATEDSARDLASSMNLLTSGGRADVTPLMGRPAFDFAYFAAGHTPEPISYTFKPFEMERQPRMTEAEWQQVRQQIRDRYYEPRHRDQAPRPQASSPASRPARARLLPAEPVDVLRPPEEPQTGEVKTEGATGWGDDP